MYTHEFESLGHLYVITESLCNHEYVHTDYVQHRDSLDIDILGFSSVGFSSVGFSSVGFSSVGLFLCNHEYVHTDYVQHRDSWRHRHCWV